MFPDYIFPREVSSLNLNLTERLMGASWPEENMTGMCCIYVRKSGSTGALHQIIA